MTNEDLEQVVFDKPTNLQELYKTYDYWLYLTSQDKEALDVILAAALDRDIAGDPLWLYVISPPGGVKTELLRALRGYPKIYRLDSLTAATFVSGKVEKDSETGEMIPIAGILEHINGKVLIIKDFTVVLSESDITRSAIFGQLRAIHDGYFEKAFGTLPEPIRVESKIGLIAGVTPAIDRYTKAHSILGERFLKIRLHPEPQTTAEKSFKNLGREEEMRQCLATATAHYLKFVVNNKTIPNAAPLTEEFIKIAHYIALMRTRVFARYYHGQITDLDITEPEVPTRVAKQLKKLAIGLTIIRRKNEITEQEMATIKRVAKDCSIPSRQKIIDCLATFTTKIALPFELNNALNVPLNTVLNELMKMQVLGIVEKTATLKPENKPEHHTDDELDYYAMTRTFEKLYHAVSK